ncbi:uracil-DNA glycosylase [Oricola cellulosilytica]|nr:uracil-DNA glycosylase [Oricola cellulosilytica]
MKNTTGPSRGELENLLRFYAESGLDFPLADEPVDRFTPVEPPAREAAQADPGEKAAQTAHDARSGGDLQPTLTRLPAIPDAEASALAEKAAAGAETLDELRGAVEAFEGCNLKMTARSTVFEGGMRGARLMMISDAPGRDDDTNGEAITGPEGALFDRMLAAIGLTRDDCYLGFAVPWRVPGNGAPSPLQASICKPFAERQIELANPELVVLLGNGAARIFLERTGNILQVRGKWKILRTRNGFEAPVIATLQPRYLLEQPAQKRFAWADLQMIRDRLAETGSGV